MLRRALACRDICDRRWIYLTSKNQLNNIGRMGKRVRYGLDLHIFYLPLPYNNTYLQDGKSTINYSSSHCKPN